MVTYASDASLPTPADVLDFWFSAGPKKWFAREDAFDDAIGDRFLTLHGKAANGGIDEWAMNPEGTLALIIVLDQFSRNLYRNSPKAFATDEKALGLSQNLISKRQDIEFPINARLWIYMPFQHSEDLEIQDRSIELFETIDDPENLRFAHIHRDIIQQFGRFPHRNQVLGRTSSAEELKFLADGGFSG